MRCKACNRRLGEKDFVADPIGELCRTCFSYALDEEEDEESSRSSLTYFKTSQIRVKKPERDGGLIRKPKP
jgi:hypothetical protein